MKEKIKLLKLKELKLYGFTFKIKSQDELILDRENLAEINPRTQEISYDSFSSDERITNSILHEVLEFIISENSIIMEHKDLQIIANGIYQFLMDNNLLK